MNINNLNCYFDSSLRVNVDKNNLLTPNNVSSGIIKYFYLPRSFKVYTNLYIRTDLSYDPLQYIMDKDQNRRSEFDNIEEVVDRIINERINPLLKNNKTQKQILSFQKVYNKNDSDLIIDFNQMDINKTVVGLDVFTSAETNMFLSCPIAVHTVVHEFMHILGYYHEHQKRKCSINEGTIICENRSCLNFTDETLANFVIKYGESVYNNNIKYLNIPIPDMIVDDLAYDEYSIMCYYFPPSYFVDELEMSKNYIPSERDIYTIKKYNVLLSDEDNDYINIHEKLLRDQTSEKEKYIYNLPRNVLARSIHKRNIAIIIISILMGIIVIGGLIYFFKNRKVSKSIKNKNVRFSDEADEFLVYDKSQ